MSCSVSNNPIAVSFQSQGNRINNNDEIVERTLLNRISSPFSNNKEGSYCVAQSKILMHRIQRQISLPNLNEIDYKVEADELPAMDPNRDEESFLYKKIFIPLKLGILNAEFFSTENYESKNLDVFLNNVRNVFKNDNYTIAFPVKIALNGVNHAMFLEIEKTGDKQICVKFFNTGIANGHHAKGNRNRTHALTYTLNEEQFFDSARKESIEELMHCLRTAGRQGKRSDRAIMKMFYQKLDNAFGVQNAAGSLINKAKGQSYNNQILGNCNFKSLSVWMHNKFKECVLKKEVDPKELYKFKLKLAQEDKTQLQSSQVKLRNTRMRIFFNCFKGMSEFYTKIKKRNLWVLAFFIELFFTYRSRDVSKIKRQLNHNLDLRISKYTRKIAGIDSQEISVA